jgi:hypothetical protein
MQSYPLKTICESWDGNIVNPYYNYLINGINQKDSELSNKQFILILARLKFDIDGLYEYIDNLFGFININEAHNFIKTTKLNIINKTIHRNTYEDYKWKLTNTSKSLRRIDNHLIDNIESIYYKLLSFKEIGPTQTFNTEYFHIELLKISLPATWKDAMNYLDIQEGWKDYFVKIGESLNIN